MNSVTLARKQNERQTLHAYSISILKESITKFIIEKTVLHDLREPFRTDIRK